MSGNRGLNDTEVAAEVKKMTEFIRQEAQEKAREIQVKVTATFPNLGKGKNLSEADEEHNIEKAKIVRQETINIEAAYEKKLKLAQVQRKIALSNHLNKCRLKVLQAREEKLEKLVEEAKNKLSLVHSDKEAYRKLLHGLLMQGLFLLMEDSVSLMVKKEDVELVKGLLKTAETGFTEKTGKTIQVSISDQNLPSSSAGGIVLSAHDGKIVCNNSLEARLNLSAEKLLPAVRTMLFGITESRRFFD